MTASASRGRTLVRNACSTRGATFGSSQAAPRGDSSGGRDEVVGGRVLQDEAGGAGVEGAPQGVVVVERREDQDRRSIVRLGRSEAGRGDPVDPAHAHIHEHEVGAVLCDGADDLVAVVALGHDLEAVVRPEDPGDAGPDDVWSSTMRTRITSPRIGSGLRPDESAVAPGQAGVHQPAVGRRSGSRSPPSARARSRIPTSPKCPHVGSARQPAGRGRPRRRLALRPSVDVRAMSSTCCAEHGGRRWRAPHGRCGAAPCRADRPAIVASRRSGHR